MSVTSATMRFRSATREDLPTIVQILADDALGAHREIFSDPPAEAYVKAFNAIDTDGNNQLVVAVAGNDILGFYQITYIPYLTYSGGWRALVEGVRVNKRYRGEGIGRQLLSNAIEQAKQQGCHLIQLTTDKQRPDAVAFYLSLGFVASHEGMKLHLDRHDPLC